VLAEEIVQDVFVKVWTKRHQLTGLDSFRNWLFIVSRNHIYNELNKRIKDPNFVKNLEDYFLIAEGSTADRLLYKESEKLIKDAVDLLSPQQRTIYLLSREEGLKHEEIATRLGISANTVKVHMGKALHNLRKYLESHSSGLVFIYALFRALL
jgi:RNA polymerase sigma-70 factor (family 1)